MVSLAIAGLAWTFGTVASAFTSFTVPVGANPGAEQLLEDAGSKPLLGRVLHVCRDKRAMRVAR